MSVSNNSSEIIAPISSRIAFYPVPQGVAQYSDAELYVGDQKIDLYNVKANNSQIWNGLAPVRVDNGVAIIRLEGRVTLTVKTNYALFPQYTKVRPLEYGIQPTFDIQNNSFSFEINSLGKYVIEPNGERIKAIHLFVNALDGDEIDTSASNVIYFGPGLHDATTDARLSNNSTIILSNNQIAYVAYGAVVRGRFLSSNTTGVQIRGGGVIDGSTFPRIAGQPSGNTAFVPLDFTYCTNVTFADFTMLDPAGWTVNWYFTTNSTIDNINIITSRSNGDGISLQSCQEIEVSNSFIRGWDDNLVVKNYPRWYDRSQHGTTRNILFHDCILWTDLAQSMEIGYETVGAILENVRFENITVLHNYHKPVISIHNGNNANIENIVFKDITIEDASMGGGDAGSNRQLIHFSNLWSANWSDQHTITSLGSIDGVLVENVKVIAGNNDIPIEITGCQDTRDAYYGNLHYVKNVIVRDVSFKGVNMTPRYAFFIQNEYTENISLLNSGSIITGSTITRTWTIEELAAYSEIPSIIS